MSISSVIDQKDIWISWVEEEGEEELIPYLNFSKPCLERLGWQVGDELLFEMISDDPPSCVIKKKINEGILTEGEDVGND